MVTMVSNNSTLTEVSDFFSEKRRTLKSSRGFMGCAYDVAYKLQNPFYLRWMGRISCSTGCGQVLLWLGWNKVHPPTQYLRRWGSYHAPRAENPPPAPTWIRTNKLCFEARKRVPGDFARQQRVHRTRLWICVPSDERGTSSFSLTLKKSPTSVRANDYW